MAPHFASEMWSRFVSAPDRKILNPQEIDWSSNVLCQRWPEVDDHHPLNIAVKINNLDIVTFKFPRKKFDVLKHDEVLQLALENKEVAKSLSGSKIISSKFDHYQGCQAFFHITLNKPVKKFKKEKKKKIVEISN